MSSSKIARPNLTIDTTANHVDENSSCSYIDDIDICFKAPAIENAGAEAGGGQGFDELQE